MKADLRDNLKGAEVRIFEVGPRDGLQNEPRQISLRTRIGFVQALAQAGFRDIEVGSFVRADRVPQMAETDKMQPHRIHLEGVRAWYLVPNEKGLLRALKAGVQCIAVFTAASESFNLKNIGMTQAQSFKEIQRIIDIAKGKLGKSLRLRGYVSTAFGCPFEGRVPTQKVIKWAEKLAHLGVDQISIGDTIGVATPADVSALMKPLLSQLGQKRLAVHFHDTRGTALANSLRSMELGVRMFDSSAGGLGGCPFAPGASGNLATEDLVYMLNGMGVKTGVNLKALCELSLKLSWRMNRPLTSRYLQAYAVERSK